MLGLEGKSFQLELFESHRTSWLDVPGMKGYPAQYPFQPVCQF